ncbi:hypothetical protein CCUS01_15527 [Colletotrichum cuscutae]|uniref:Uncharacterized protein n=1 Tax=Colletotrichum cuscutae TaxID=1209917 RepID=A0AAI9VI77_9PEZI|nr:hypothetical protein CCUS01_15527 [Colletotrichum cuscutae]
MRYYCCGYGIEVIQNASADDLYRLRALLRKNPGLTPPISLGIRSIRHRKSACRFTNGLSRAFGIVNNSFAVNIRCNGIIHNCELHEREIRRQLVGVLYWRTRRLGQNRVGINQIKQIKLIKSNQIKSSIIIMQTPRQAKRL